MVLGVEDQEFGRVMEQAHEAGVKLEIHQGLPIWEFLPSPRHTIELERIHQSVKRLINARQECGCHRYQDLSIRFPDGSIRRPDLSIYCTPPKPTQESTTAIPGAVVELVSPGSEVKDLELSPPFYLAHGVLDVIVFDPSTGVVHHFRREGQRQHQSPLEIETECGCVLTV